MKIFSIFFILLFIVLSTSVIAAGGPTHLQDYYYGLDHPEDVIGNKKIYDVRRM